MLSQDQNNRVSAWLADKKIYECPCCKKPLSRDLAGSSIARAIVRVICNNCYFVLQFNTKILTAFIPGLTPP